MTTYTQLLNTHTSNPSTISIISESVGTTSSVFFGKGITDVKFMLYNLYSNTGTLTCGVFSSSGVLKHTFYTMDITTLPTTNTGLITAPSVTPYTGAMSVGDGIGVSATAMIGLAVKLTDVFDGVNTVWTSNGSTLGNAYECAFEITTTAVTSTGGRLPPPPIVLGGL